MLFFPTLMAYTEVEEDKFTALYTTYYNQLYYFARDRLHSIHDAEDVLQETFGRVLNHLNDIEEVNCSKTRGFLFIIVKRECIRVYARNQKELNCGDGTDIELLCTGNGQDEVWEIVEPKVAVEGILEHLRCLPEADQQLFLLKHYYGFSYRELASLFDMSEKNVSVKLARIKQRLLGQFGKGGAKREEAD